MTPAGFPHSDISGSKPACDSPKLFAANHVLHRFLTPRHSPCALSSLVTNFPWNPKRVPHLRARFGRQSLPSLAQRPDEEAEAHPSIKIVAHLLFSIAIRRLQGRECVSVETHFRIVILFDA